MASTSTMFGRPVRIERKQFDKLEPMRRPFSSAAVNMRTVRLMTQRPMIQAASAASTFKPKSGPWVLRKVQIALCSSLSLRPLKNSERIISKHSLRLQGFNPHVGAQTWLLVLGSFPGVASLQAQQYYGHPRNQFWRLLDDALNLPLAAADYPTRLERLERAGVGLWDVITETQRRGSLDSDIREPLGSDLSSLTQSLPVLTTIGFNGGTAARIGLRQLGDAALRYRIVLLPSSSPAYTVSYADKLIAWQQLSAPA